MKKNKIVKISTLAAGALALGSMNGVNAKTLFSSQDLGTGAELRSELLSSTNFSHSIMLYRILPPIK